MELPPLSDGRPMATATPTAYRVGSPWTVALAAAAAVALVGGARWGEMHAPASSVPHVAQTTRAVRGITLGDSLELGDVVESKTRSLAYEKAGLVTFTVAPLSRIQLTRADQDGERPGALTIALTKGSVHAEVRPQAQGEAFAVEVEHTRVAVHGTSFTVSREGDRVIVEVMHGSVAIGPAGHPGSTQGWLLVGPDHASFSLDGAREAQWLGVPSGSPYETARAGAARSDRPLDQSAGDAEGTRSPKQVSMAGPTGRAGRSPSARVESAPPRSPDDTASDKPQTAGARGPAEQDEAATAAILKGLDACYERQVGSFGVRFSIQSSLTLAILPNGAIREGVFDPPLSPTLMNCARDAITSARFTGTESVRQIRVPVNLSRP
jgi:FecR-like protein